RQRLGQDAGYLGSGVTTQHDGSSLLVRISVPPAGRSSQVVQFKVRGHGGQLTAKQLTDALQPGGTVGLEAQHQHRCGVGGAYQTPAIGLVDADAVDTGNTCLLAPVRVVLQCLDQGEL